MSEPDPKVEKTTESDLIEARISVVADMEDPLVAEIIDNGGALELAVDAKDIVSALDNVDELILVFITQMLMEAGSSELRERLAERLAEWDKE